MMHEVQASTSADPVGASRRYRAFGIVLEGPRRFLDRHCDSAPVGSDPTLAVDVCHESPHIDMREWQLAVDTADRSGPYQRFSRRFDCPARNEVLFELRGGLAIHCRPGAARMTVHVPVNMNTDSVGAFITGTAMTFHFRAMGRLCLHAAALVKDDYCVLLCGPSGAGKSSFAAALHAAGWAVVAEDLSVMEFEREQCAVRPGYGRVRLWSKSVVGLGVRRQANAIVEGADKYYLQTAAASGERYPVTHLLFLGDRASTPQGSLELGVESSPGAALVRLYQNTLAPYANTADDARKVLSQCARMLKLVQTRTLQLCDGFESLQAAAGALTGKLHTDSCRSEGQLR